MDVAPPGCCRAFGTPIDPVADEADAGSSQAIDKHRGALVKPPRAAPHVGEIELRGLDIGGIAVHAAVRVMAQAGADEVLVSRGVTDLVGGAGLKFADRGSHELKGPPGRRDLFAASP